MDRHAEARDRKRAKRKAMVVRGRSIFVIKDTIEKRIQNAKRTAARRHRPSRSG